MIHFAVFFEVTCCKWWTSCRFVGRIVEAGPEVKAFAIGDLVCSPFTTCCGARPDVHSQYRTSLLTLLEFAMQAAAFTAQRGCRADASAAVCLAGLQTV